MELLAISLDVERLHYKDLFEDGCSIMRCNYYPSCQQPSLALGTGPHCDPTTLTILHQDQVGGLDVFADKKWQAIRPRHDALVVNIGDTFTVRRPSKYTCNGKSIFTYKVNTDILHTIFYKTFTYINQERKREKINKQLLKIMKFHYFVLVFNEKLLDRNSLFYACRLTFSICKIMLIKINIF